MATEEEKRQKQRIEEICDRVWKALIGNAYYDRELYRVMKNNDFMHKRSDFSAMGKFGIESLENLEKLDARLNELEPKEALRLSLAKELEDIKRNLLAGKDLEYNKRFVDKSEEIGKLEESKSFQHWSYEALTEFKSFVHGLDVEKAKKINTEEEEKQEEKPKNNIEFKDEKKETKKVRKKAKTEQVVEEENKNEPIGGIVFGGGGSRGRGVNDGHVKLEDGASNAEYSKESINSVDWTGGDLKELNKWGKQARKDAKKQTRTKEELEKTQARLIKELSKVAVQSEKGEWVPKSLDNRIFSDFEKRLNLLEENKKQIADLNKGDVTQGLGHEGSIESTNDNIGTEKQEINTEDSGKHWFQDLEDDKQWEEKKEDSKFKKAGKWLGDVFKSASGIANFEKAYEINKKNKEAGKGRYDRFTDKEYVTEYCKGLLRSGIFAGSIATLGAGAAGVTVSSSAATTLSTARLVKGGMLGADVLASITKGDLMDQIKNSATSKEKFKKIAGFGLRTGLAVTAIFSNAIGVADGAEGVISELGEKINEWAGINGSNIEQVAEEIKVIEEQVTTVYQEEAVDADVNVEQENYVKQDDYIKMDDATIVANLDSIVKQLTGLNSQQLLDIVNSPSKGVVSASMEELNEFFSSVEYTDGVQPQLLTQMEKHFELENGALTQAVEAKTTGDVEYGDTVEKPAESVDKWNDLSTQVPDGAQQIGSVQIWSDEPVGKLFIKDGNIYGDKLGDGWNGKSVEDFRSELEKYAGQEHGGAKLVLNATKLDGMIAQHNNMISTVDNAGDSGLPAEEIENYQQSVKESVVVRPAGVVEETKVDVDGNIVEKQTTGEAITTARGVVGATSGYVPQGEGVIELGTTPIAGPQGSVTVHAQVGEDGHVRFYSEQWSNRFNGRTLAELEAAGANPTTVSWVERLAGRHGLDVENVSARVVTGATTGVETVTTVSDVGVEEDCLPCKKLANQEKGELVSRGEAVKQVNNMLNEKLGATTVAATVPDGWRSVGAVTIGDRNIEVIEQDGRYKFPDMDPNALIQNKTFEEIQARFPHHGITSQVAEINSMLQTENSLNNVDSADMQPLDKDITSPEEVNNERPRRSKIRDHFNMERSTIRDDIYK